MAFDVPSMSMHVHSEKCSATCSQSSAIQEHQDDSPHHARAVVRPVLDVLKTPHEFLRHFNGSIVSC